MTVNLRRNFLEKQLLVARYSNLETFASMKRNILQIVLGPKHNRCSLLV